VPFLKRIVIGEDEDAIAHLLEAALGDAGYLCLRGSNGEEALALARSQAPDLMILDVLMPKLDGIETVRRLKADPVHSKVPVLMLTSLGAVEDKVRGLDAGADDYLAKPFDIRELLARVQSLVRLSRRERDRSPITDLPGPATLEETLAARLERGEQFALLFVELEGFERFVSHHGWRRGDEALAQLGATLRASVPASATLTHLGGGDFAVIAAVDEAAPLTETLRHRAGAALADHATEDAPLNPAFVRVDSTGARTVEELARAVALGRNR
jgi:DNA-binding response OmpR family regulator